MLNQAFWAAAIAFSYVIRLLPTGSGHMPKIDKVLIPIIQIMLASASALGQRNQD